MAVTSFGANRRCCAHAYCKVPRQLFTVVIRLACNMPTRLGLRGALQAAVCDRRPERGS